MFLKNLPHLLVQVLRRLNLVVIGITSVETPTRHKTAHRFSKIEDRLASYVSFLVVILNLDVNDVDRAVVFTAFGK